MSSINEKKLNFNLKTLNFALNNNYNIDKVFIISKKLRLL